MSVVGRIHLIKMILLPKCLYIFSHSPVVVPKKFFKKLNSQFIKCIWAKGRCKVHNIRAPKGRGRVGAARCLFVLLGRTNETFAYLVYTATKLRRREVFFKYITS